MRELINLKGILASVAAAVVFSTPASAAIMQMTIGGANEFISDTGDVVFPWFLRVVYDSRLVIDFGGDDRFIGYDAFLDGYGETTDLYLGPLKYPMPKGTGYLEFASPFIYAGGPNFAAVLDGCNVPEKLDTNYKRPCFGGGGFGDTGFVYTDYIEFKVLSPAPEPSSWALLVGGLVFAGGAIRRRIVAAPAA